MHSGNSYVNTISQTLSVRTYIDLRTPGFPPDSLDGDVFAHFSPSPLASGLHQEVRPAGQPRRISLPIGLEFGPENTTPGTAGFDMIPKSALDGRPLMPPEFSKEQHETFLAAYNRACLMHNQGLIREALQVIANPANYPLAFGCMTGKDRTGMISMFVLSVLGATRQEILDDYIASNLALQQNSALVGRSFAVVAQMKEDNRLPEGMQNPDFGKIIDGVSASKNGNAPKSSSASGVALSVMVDTLAFLQNDHQGPIAYLLSIGVTQGDFESIRSILLEGFRPSKM